MIADVVAWLGPWFALLFPAGLLVAALVSGIRTDRRNSQDSEIQASVTRNYRVPADVLFGRRDAYVQRGRDGEWHPFTLSGQPELSAQPAPVEVEEGAA